MDSLLGIVEAFLAFALTMLGFATVTSAIVGIVHGITRLRALGLYTQADYFFRNDLIYELTRKNAGPAEGDMEQERLRFLADILLHPVSQTNQRELNQDRAGRGIVAEEPNPYQDPRIETIELIAEKIGQAKAWPNSWDMMFRSDLRRLLGPVPERLEARDFRSRLHNSLVGRRLKNAIVDTEKAKKDKGEDASVKKLGAEQMYNALLDDIAARFMAMGRSATDRFARDARRVAVIAGLVLAFALNADSFVLLETYLTDPQTRAQILTQQDTLIAGAKAGELKTDDPAQTLSDQGAVHLKALNDKIVEQADDFDTNIAAFEQLAATLTPASANLDCAQADPAVPQDRLYCETQTLKHAVARLKDGSQKLTYAGQAVLVETAKVERGMEYLTETFPVGWHRFPACGRPETDRRCSQQSPAGQKPCNCFLGDMWRWLSNNFSASLKWLLGVGATGLMAGLGAPFWVQVVHKLARMRQGLKPEDVTAAKPA